MTVHSDDARPKTPPASEIHGIIGLIPSKAEVRLRAGQCHKPLQPAGKSIGRIILDNIASVFNAVIGTVIIFLLVFFVVSGDTRLWLDAIGAVTVAVFNTAIAIAQEVKAKRALDKVNLLLPRELTVIRAGRATSIQQCQIVLGDVILMKRGDQAVADGEVVQSNHMEIDESLLTGESVPRLKEPGQTILSGSFCLSGNGAYQATELGDSSYASRVTQMARQLKAVPSPLQRQINRLVILLFGSAVMLCLLQVSTSVDSRALDTELVRKIATILIALVPQGLVLMASVTFAVGIHRISTVGAIVQAFNAIESFANVQVICMDKTGTLTQNRMTVRAVTPLAVSRPAEELKRLLGTYAWLSSDKNATIRAIEAFAPDRTFEAVGELPFDSRTKLSALTVVQNGKKRLLVLGAFDVLLDQLEPSAFQDALDTVRTAHLSLYRNLLFGEVPDPQPIECYSGKPGLFRIMPICIVSISDTIRQDVSDVINGFEKLGIKFKVLSGDSADSILATCRDIGWDIPDAAVLTGPEIDRLDRGKLPEEAEKRIVFARLRPEHKLDIIKALRARSIYTAMIGDGVNDVPAIKSADLGVAMEDGAAITREIADVVLLKNRFILLPQVFHEGERIIGTVSSIARLFLTKNFAVIYTSLISSIWLLEFPLTPRRVAFLNIFAIGLPAILMAITNSNTRKPKRFSLDTVSFVTISALVIVGAAYTGLLLTRAAHLNPEDEDLAEMVMISILIVTSVVNFLVVVFSGATKKIGYAIYGVLLILVYFLVVNATPANLLIRSAKTFYEISSLDAASWRIVILVCSVSSAVLVIAQRLRSAIVNRNAGEVVPGS